MPVALELPAAVRQPSARVVERARALVVVAASLPLVALAVEAASTGLGANPIERFTRETGEWTLYLLLATLSVTPLRRLTGMHWLLRLRRRLGLSAFAYGCLHFATWLWLDQWFDLAAIVADIVKRPYVTAGFAAFALMLPLAATSTDAMVRRLGAARWQRLHRLAWASGVLGVLHYLWLVKVDLRPPLACAAVLAVLLAARLLLRRRTGARP